MKEHPPLKPARPERVVGFSWRNGGALTIYKLIEAYELVPGSLQSPVSMMYEVEQEITDPDEIRAFFDR